MRDSDYLMLENLTYCSGSNYGANEIKDYTGRSVSDFLEQFDEKKISEMDKSKNQEDHEWAAMIRYMKNNADISSLKIRDVNSENGLILFEDSKNPNHAIVAFEGTRGGIYREWEDNGNGLAQADTEAQKKAKAYIDSLNYDSVSVTGHSKGGNKAMYVAITSDKVDKCIAYDGQGFSKAFMDKYSVRIQERASIVSNYSLETDFVHILLFQIPGSNQVYMQEGSDVNGLPTQHFAQSAFSYKLVDGKWVIVTSNDNIIKRCDENPYITELHNFIAFFMNNATEEELNNMTELFSKILKLVDSNKITKKDANGKEVLNVDAIVAVLLEGNTSEDTAILLVAYLLKYLKENNYNVDDLIRIMEALGISEEQFTEILAKFLSEKTGINISPDMAKKVVNFLFDQITDGSEDAIINGLIGFFGGEEGAVINAYWKKIEEKYNNIKVKSTSPTYEAKIRDYSISNYNVINETMNSIDRISVPEVNSWNNYSGYSWFSKLMVSMFVRCINQYGNHLATINSNCRSKFMKVFNNMADIDLHYSNNLNSIELKTKTLRGEMSANL